MIKLIPVDMTPEIMYSLEQAGLIHRLCPGADTMHAEKNTTAFRSIYESHDRYGGHKLITVTVNVETFEAFGSHPDNEEFLLIGDPDTKPMYLLVSYAGHDVLARKIKDETVSPGDFILLRVRYNDPYVSFFVMKKGVPHGECSAPGDGSPGSFYVTESRGLYTDYIDVSSLFEGF